MAWYAHSTYARLEPCEYPGCHGGQIDCCDGLRENMPHEVAERYEEAAKLK